MSSKTLNDISDEEFARFYDSLKFTLSWEKGYVNDPEDPGGETKWGIAKRFHPDEDIPNLTPERAAEIYYDEYWVPSGASELPLPLCTLVFDTAVLLGVSRATRWLKECGNDYAAFLATRRQHHLTRSKPRFVKGHLNRVNNLEQYVYTLLQK